ncbi:hypothetical protein RVR_4931 [Actinacidiphila reveromycinica]|uniref:Uncharacterized protein n=1 Tax=Actinacidiphila reveromycinica TaxID=659352 RepID=A0A7U3VPI9_9ACTN|nr:DUF6344 domain-containing protein [Streptomyces sp. SN-593]BBA98659.1 hypothetical protein RVR_4931 [Streptomyces sp. SN-593]
MAADIKTFWGALLSVLLKCIAALGFTAADRAAARRQAAAQAPATSATSTVTPTPTAVATARVAAGTGEAREAREAVSAGAPATGTPAPARSAAPPRRGQAKAHVPAPRTAESRLVRRSRGRTLPPTMKQRIGAEAHGASPSARSLRTAEPLDEFGDLGALATAAGAPAAATTSAAASTAASTDRGARAHRAHVPGRAVAKATRELFTRAA